ncbi:hypothetical protein [Rubinisphaera italica]|uniref:Uncharacterized protein n=1 Tax=Rubinisphaera italica TaxID=2527969 RepID=A0A5C5XGM9_9PLAN|nr:hypothetical protein [Rubinisphaera italica]TWT62140.1 hypothetical protein Pan54_28800 [Rubinisphaera italica]
MDGATSLETSYGLRPPQKEKLSGSPVLRPDLSNVACELIERLIGRVTPITVPEAGHFLAGPTKNAGGAENCYDLYQE